MDEPENTKQLSSRIEHLAMQRATDQANTAKWGLNVAIFSYAILITIIILVSQGIGFSIVATLGVVGLVMIWLMGWKQGNRLRQRFYAEELLSLQEKPGKGAAASVAQLSSREKQILSYVAQGYTNKRIAIELGISEQTIKNHVTSVLRRLHANDRTEAVVIAIKQGLISIS